MYKGSKVAGRVERECISRVGNEPRFVVDLTTSVKQVDVHLVRSPSAVSMVGMTTIPVTQFGALDE